MLKIINPIGISNNEIKTRLSRHVKYEIRLYIRIAKHELSKIEMENGKKLLW
jgi:hypothetical protein